MAAFNENTSKTDLIQEIERLQALLINFEKRIEIISTWFYSEFDVPPEEIKTQLNPVKNYRHLEKKSVTCSGKTTPINNEPINDPLSVEDDTLNGNNQFVCKEEFSDCESVEEHHHLPFEEHVECTENNEKNIMKVQKLKEFSNMPEASLSIYPQTDDDMVKVENEAEELNIVEPEDCEDNSQSAVNYECGYCGKSFHNKINLKEHMLKHKRHRKKFSSKFKCKFCGKTYAYNISLQNHLRKCEKMDNKSSALNSHNESLKSVKTRTLRSTKNNSNIKFSDLGEKIEKMDENMEGGSRETNSKLVQKETNKVELYINCNHCGKIFNRRILFYKHLEQSSCSLSCNFDSCTATFSHLNKLNEHLRRIHKKFNCIFCEKVFPAMHELKKHKAELHPEHFSDKSIKDKPFVCKKCEKAFTSENFLKLHEIEHEKGEKNTACNICKQIFTKRYSLVQHMERKHSTNNAFICNVCGKGKSSMRLLNLHLKTAHLDQDKRKIYECKPCNKTFTTRTGHYLHRKSVHEGTAAKICTMCGHTFASLAVLNNHIRGVHEKKRPHSCHLCDKSFKTKNALMYHVNTHSNPNSKKRGYNKDKP